MIPGNGMADIIPDEADFPQPRIETGAETYDIIERRLFPAKGNAGRGQ
jgi:hypothetical protein